MVEPDAWFRSLPPATRPLYDMADVNLPIDLYIGDLTLRPGQGGSSVSGRVFIRWLPAPQTRFELCDEGLRPTFDDSRLNLDELKTSCRVALTSVSPSEHRFSGRLCSDPSLQGNQVERITFHVPNFHSYSGDTIYHETGAWRGRLVLQHRVWRITLDQVSRENELRRSLKADGGFAITNVGTLARVDGRHISKRKVTDLLKALYFFLSFCRGMWCGPMLAVGELRGATNWLQWVSPRIASWRYRHSWWPELEADQGMSISRAFSGFMTLWNRPLWQEPLMNAVHWYVEANSNSGGVEGGIVLVQTALELLSWIVVVEDPKTSRFAEQHFDKRFSAGDRIRQLLGTLSIPIDVPATMSELATALPNLQSSNGVDAIVAIRNGLVHPRKTRRTQLLGAPTSARIEALTLGLWFLEIALLRLFRYNGLYYSRLKHGTNADVRTEMP